MRGLRKCSVIGRKSVIFFHPIMEIALQRIEECVDGILDLSHLKLTELPPLPKGLIKLYCDRNYLTFLPPLPDGLIELRCDSNRLTSLPELPSSLQEILCTGNKLTCLPSFPSSLITFICQFNKLTTLPPLPSSLDKISVDFNSLTALPKLPISLTHLSCDGNNLTSLPSLHHGLNKLHFFLNPLETLPELPSTLSSLSGRLPHDKQDFRSNELTPEKVQELNQENEKWMDPYKKERCMKRCAQYKEEIMIKAWHPSRVEKLIEMGYDMEDI
jgi:hypothetical protein